MKKYILVFVAAFLFALFGLLFLMPGPKISVVMSTYNRSSSVSAAIESILNQSYDNFEFIIINDGSSDNTSEVLAEYAQKDSRIKILTNDKNRGLIYSLNRGLDEATGKYIARMDDDDFSLPERFEKQLDFMESHPEFAGTGSWVANPQTGKVYNFQREINPERNKITLYFNATPISHPAAFIRRHFLEKHNIRYRDKPKYKSIEDRKFWLDILDAGGQITNVPEVLVMYRLHMSNPTKYYQEQMKNVSDFRYEILNRFGVKPHPQDICQEYFQMVEKNKLYHLLKQEMLEQHVQKICPPLTGEKVKHPYWEDAFVFHGERVCRERKPKDCALLISKTPTILKIKWDKWGDEIFEKQDGVWVAKPDK